MSRATLGWIALALAVVALAVAGFLAAFERVDEEREVGYRGAARSNPLLAFERLATRLGIPAEHPADPLALPPTDRVVLALGAHHPPGPLYLEELLGWVAAGGHLVFVPAGGSSAATSVEPLLDRLEVEVVWPSEEELGSGEDEAARQDDGDREPADAAAEAPEGTAAEASEAEETDEEAARRLRPPIELAVSPAAPVRRVAMPRWPVLAGDPGQGDHLSGREDGPSLVAAAWGAGRVTVLADAGFLANDEIGRFDHAAFAWDLLAAARRPAGVWIADWRRAVPLSALLAARGWPLALAGGVLLAGWIVARGARFGPLLPDHPPPRRSLLEHLRASGEFLWRHGEGRELLAACRAALARRLDRGHADWARHPEGERVRRLARLANVPAGTVAAALEGDATGAADFTRTVATLERLRRSS